MQPEVLLNLAVVRALVQDLVDLEVLRLVLLLLLTRLMVLLNVL